jgi:amino acid transporter
VVLLLVVLLYRRISTIGKISLVLWVCVIGTIAWLIFGGATHFDPAGLAFNTPSDDPFAWLTFGALGAATVQTIYSYLGYYNVCHLGGEIRDPERSIPRSIFISVIGIAILYLAMNISVLGAIPWQEAAKSEFIISTFVERLYGHTAANIATGLVLVIAVSSLFSALLGYSRVPYAAAVDGRFFKIFARTHPTKHFPHISLLLIGAVAFGFSLFFKLKDVITAIIAMRIIVQFISQAVGVMVLRRRRPDMRLPFRMWLYPLPALVAIVAWAAIFVSTGNTFMLSGAIAIAAGAVVYLIRAAKVGEWPFERDEG